jgi:hypothetical protein
MSPMMQSLARSDVVLPRVDIDEFVDRIIGAQKVDVLLVVGGNLIAVVEQFVDVIVSC